MKLKCDNIGKISSTEVEINTITLIAGLNSTGKSTVGKLLYCIFNSFYNFEENAHSTLKNFIANSIYESGMPFPGIDECVEEIYKLRFTDNSDLINNIIKEFAGERFFTKKNQNTSEKIIELLNLSDDDIYKWILQSKFYSEFGNQIQNVFSEKKKASVTLKIQNSDIGVEIKDDKIFSILNAQSLKTEVIYIDDPFVLDDLSVRRRYNTIVGRDHKSHLQRNLIKGTSVKTDMESAIHELLTTKKIDKIYNMIDSVCKGNIIHDSQSGFSYEFEGSKKKISLSNLSTGLKTFSIIKTLLVNNSLESKGTIVLDEPEIHLHPEWQKLLAEVIVMIQKEFGMHILINSHSPYFINAIDVYAKKYGIRNTCKFYLAKDDDETGMSSSIHDVSDNIEEINKLLFVPLQELENERAEIEEDNKND